MSWALMFAAVQFLLTLYGSPLPTPVNWVPLLVMALTVGMFEAVIFWWIHPPGWRRRSGRCSG